MGLTPRRAAILLVICGVAAIVIAIGLLLSPPAALLALGICAVALGLEELLRP